MKQKIAWIIPIYNEELNIPRLIETLDLLSKKIETRYEIEYVFVDDGSKDQSMHLLEQIYNERTNVKVLSFSRNFGHQMAITAGLDAASADAYIFIDADLQDPPDVSLELIAKWEEGYDVVYAQRRSRKDTFFKKMTAHFFYRILNHFSDVDIPADTGDFRLITEQVAQVLRGLKEKHRFIRGLVSYIGFSQTAVLFDRNERKAGVSGYSLKKMIKLASDALTGFSLSPLSLINTAGCWLFGIGFLAVLVSAILQQWVALVVAVMTVLSGVNLLALGVIGQYVGKTFQEAQSRPLYIVKKKLVR